MSLPVFSLYTEPYGSTGNIGENFLRLLGAPALNPLQTVIREAVQNIADAAKLGTGPEVLIRLRHLDSQERSVLKGHVLAELPDAPASRVQLENFLADEGAAVLEICDFGTTGLGGPTRADRIPVDADRTDFINFLRNIGTPRDTEKGGGTYGFGKAALYSVSKCRTILVDTLAVQGSTLERRLIGCHIGARHEVIDGGMRRQFTGRHWWGVPDPGDGIADPAIGEAAKQLAGEIGLPKRGESRSGTTIMILDFDTEGDDLRTVGSRIIEGLLWSFWPRMMEDAPLQKRFRCTVEVEGEVLQVPAPENFPPLDLYCKAMRAARTGIGNDVRPIACQRPIKDLGRLAIEKGLRAPRDRLVEKGSLFPPASHHIALMRPVELVVKYLAGTPLPDERCEWAGVFIVDDEEEVERAFAFSEPPAHDDWVPSNLERGYAKTYVRVALRALEACAHEMGELASAQPGSAADAPPLAKVAGRLGAALAGVGGDGAGPSRGGGGGGGGGPRPLRARASRPIFERLMRDDGGTIAVFSTHVTQDGSRSGVHLTATPAVAMDGGAVSRLDTLISAPRIISIRSADGETASDDGRCELGGAEGDFEILVRVPGDCAVTVDATVETEAA